MLKRQHVYVTFLVLSAIASACGGEDGKMGATGSTGEQGERGPAGPKGEPGDEGPAGPAGEPGMNAGDGGETGVGGAPANALSSSCLSPCHGFTGIVEQWKTSRHFASYVANLGGEEVDTWTGTNACGNCHAIDGIEQRLAGNVRHQGTQSPTNVTHGQINYLNNSTTPNRVSESTYAGHATVAVVHCTTCHEVTEENDPHRTGKAYTPGSFPLRVPTGDDEQAWIEKSSAVGTVDGTPTGAYGPGNACMWCHKSRKDVTNYITASNNINYRWGPHQGPQADIYSGKGGYHFVGRTYGGSRHQGLAKGCVSCHMPESDINQGVGNHSFAPQLSACSGSSCHGTPTSFDMSGEQTESYDFLRQLRQALNDKGWLTRSEVAPFDALTPAQIQDANFEEDLPRQSSGLTADQAGAVYNYLLIARGGAGGIHNPLYVQQLIWDSYFAVVGSAPAGRPTRPASNQ